MSTMEPTTTPNAPLTDIPGIGATTADRLEALGYDTLHGLAVGYLTTDAQRIRDTLHTPTGFHNSVASLNLTNDDLSVPDDAGNAVDYPGMMLFARVVEKVEETYLVDNVTQRRHIKKDDVRTGTYMSSTEDCIDGLSIRPGDIPVDNSVVVGATEQIGYGAAPLGPNYPEAEYEPCVTIRESNRVSEHKQSDYVDCKTENYCVTLSRENVTHLGAALGIDLFESPRHIRVPDDDTPSRIVESDHGSHYVNFGIVAPFIPRD